jgi:hypothetical protein
MNKQPIEMARDNDLRLSRVAIERAARRARELAVQTGTALVLSRHGVIELVLPSATLPTDASAVAIETPGRLK